jgi:hypothetical protein
MSARRLLRGVLLSTHLIAIANVHSSAHAEALAQQVPPERLAPLLDLDKLPTATPDGRTISKNPAHHLQNCLRKRIARGELPPPETVGVSMAMLMRVSGALAELNQDDLGSWASLAYLSDRCDASASQIRSVHNYLVEHGHSLRLSRLKADDRMIGGAKRPLATARTTIRPVFALTCDQVETLTEEQVLDLIALGERRPRATAPSHPTMLSAMPAERAVELEHADEAPRALVHDVAPERAVELEHAFAAGKATAFEAPHAMVRDVAPEHRCLVEPLAALSQFTGVTFPEGAVEWVADEADRAGLVDVDQVDLTHAADALQELHNKLVQERRGAEAMGEPPPKLRGGRGLRSLILDYLKGKALWLEKHGDVYQARDAARAREQAHEALLTPEQRERRGLAPLGAVGRGEVPVAEESVRTSVAPPPRPVAAPEPTADERIAHQLRSRIALMGARLFAAPNAAMKAQLEAERADAEKELAELLERGPPE